MITYSIIQKSQLEGAQRIDAGYYQPEYLEYQKRLELINSIDLVELTKKIDVGLVSSMVNHFLDSGIPLLRTQNVKQFIIDLQGDLVYIDEDFHNKLKKSQIKPGQVLLARSGSIGDAAMVTAGFPTANSADIILIEVGNELLPEFLTAFLNSKYGRFQIERASSGGLQGHINLFSLEKLRIPKLSIDLQSEVKKIINEIEKTVDDSNSYYQEAEDLLLEELGLKDFSIEEDLSFVVNLSDVEEANRVDAEYFQPKYERLLAFVRQKVVVGDLQKLNKRGVQPIYVEDGEIKVVTSKHLGQNTIDYDNLDRTTIEEWKRNPQSQINYLDILIYTTGANVGRTSCYLKDDKAIASNHVNILRVDKLNPIYAAVYLNSILGQAQVRKLVSGSAQVELYPSDISKFIIWDAPKEVQQQIADLVRKSHEARKKSKELLEAAKRRVEEMIEKGGAPLISDLAQETDKTG